MKVWIDQDLCTGAALCEIDIPDVFVIGEDGVAYVKEGDRVLDDPGGEEAQATVPPEHEESVRSMVGACPAECIYVVE